METATIIISAAALVIAVGALIVALRNRNQK